MTNASSSGSLYVYRICEPFVGIFFALLVVAYSFVNAFVCFTRLSQRGSWGLASRDAICQFCFGFRGVYRSFTRHPVSLPVPGSSVTLECLCFSGSSFILHFDLPVFFSFFTIWLRTVQLPGSNPFFFLSFFIP